MSSNRSWSPFQVDIFNKVKTTYKNICVQACPGSGKTTTLLECINILPKNKRTIFLSFSNAIVEELKEKVPRHVKASTIHSVGYSLLARRYGKPIVDEKKYFVKAQRYLDPTDKLFWKKSFLVEDIFHLARVKLIKADINSIEELCGEYAIDFTPDVLEAVKGLLKEPVNAKTVDFTDMIYIPVRNKLKNLEQYDNVLLDESQDTNPCQLALLDLLMHPKSRLISVGDVNQSIYAFTGADHEAFKKLQGRANTITLPLSLTYRCPISHVALANEIYPNSMVAFSKEEGEIVSQATLTNIREGDMVLCRINKPLLLLYFHLLTNDIKASIIGKEIEKGLNPYVKKIQNMHSIEDAVEFLDAEKETLLNNLVDRGIKKPENNEIFIEFDEKIQLLLLILGKISHPSEIRELIDRIFDENVEGVKLMSIHKSKGLENDRVFIIENYDSKTLMPHPRATTPVELEQEDNLKYVAYTRAKKSLFFMKLKETDFDY